MYFKIGLAEEQINNIKTEISQDPKVKEVVYVSAMRHLKILKPNTKMISS